MARKGAPKNRRFDATSIPVLSPKKLGKAKRKQANPGKAARKRKKPSSLAKLARSWRFSHFLALLLIAGGVAAMAYLLTDASLRTALPNVSGNSYLKTEQILAQAHLEGQNIFTIDPSTISRRLVTFIPQIKDVRIRLSLPNRISVRIEERQPVLMYSRGDQMFWADAEGVLFPIQESLIDLPILVDEDGSASPDGQRLNPGVWLAIQEINATLPDVKEFHYRDVYGLFFISPEGWRVYLGDGNNMKEKLALWQKLHQQLVTEKRSIKTVDLRYDHVYIE